MRPALFGAVLVTLLPITPLAAREPAWRFRWQPGQVLVYRVQQVTTAAEAVGAKNDKTTTRLDLVKHWRVAEVDAAGTATLHQSVTALRLEVTRPDGEALLFDSTDPDKSNPQMRDQLGRFVGPVLTVLRLDARGRVAEVKESKHGPASRFEAEPPFVLHLPEESPRAGQSWERAYRITLEPPQGTGEKADAVQKYAVKSLTGAIATVTLATELKTPPESVADRIPFLQVLPEGEVSFDAEYGYLRSAVLKIDRELNGHQGEGSSYRFQSTYTEQYVGNK